MKKLLLILPAVALAQPVTPDSVDGTVSKPSSLSTMSIDAGNITARTLSLDGGIRFVASDGTYVDCFAPAFATQPEYLECDGPLYLPTAGIFVKSINIDDTIGGSLSFSSGGTVGFTAGTVSTQHTDVSTNIQVTGWITASSPFTKGSCVLDAGTPSQCAVAIKSGAQCGCFATGTTAAAAISVAANASGASLTCTAANGLSNTVAYICI